MIFIRYESFRVYLRMYPVTSGIIALNIAYFIIVALSGSTTDGYHVYEFGSFYTDADDPFSLDQPWRYVTSMFMHAGLMHLLFNMFSLLVFAPPLEHLLRKVRYGVFYLLCGILANAFSALLALILGEPGVHAVGASGAIYGVYGAFLYIALFRKPWLDEGSRKTVYSILIFGLIYSVITPQISLWGHVGGGLAGFLLYSSFDRAMVRRKRIR
ncbi:rhomboid family intramembrane serine protease [Paenibacillus radicis (ex Gao et al. 2016)]|uniref:Rhomboid protease YdcA n=1 Tax=Paenibacillus radicis (ex Gao et al. 2016) TaxID=1737354 RepID=A0A917GSR7_9BACL|nr:rhomboid family intramembrane serine protease [Paenibacillus radicis (ex Gao et al. 2016)]GGG55766.1 putative rhomboid protease YdcA [Paenibacillus radicis (ex Gao et al. 2016)]